MAFVIVTLMVAILPAVAEQPEAKLRRTISGQAAFGDVAANASSEGFHIAWRPDFAYCLSSEGNMLEHGVQIQLWKCDQTWQSVGQNFHRDPREVYENYARIRMSRNPSYCVVIQGDWGEDGARIQLERCDPNNKNQTWNFNYEAGQIRAHSLQVWGPPKCLAIEGSQASNGAKIKLRPCSEARDWLQLSLGVKRRTMYAVPNADKACPAPFLPVMESKETCAAAANAMRPGSGCMWPGTGLRTWAQIVEQTDEPSRPKGCYMFAGWQYGCGLFFNPTGFTNTSRSGSGPGWYVTVICQLPIQ
mmetsp:Transcript_13785/g.35000  ORF Transcript_13785/g.35000 Transcript_13785/m.35000 type:complete len:303 (+) Transcript_13785:72-980(+)